MISRYDSYGYLTSPNSYTLKVYWHQTGGRGYFQYMMLFRTRDSIGTGDRVGDHNSSESRWITDGYAPRRVLRRGCARRRL